MTEIELYAFMGQFEKIDEIIKDFRNSKSRDIARILELLIETQPYKEYLPNRWGLYKYACSIHDKIIFEGLE